MPWLARIVSAAVLALVPTLTVAESLLMLYQQTLRNNPTLLGLDAQIERLRAQEDQTRSRLKPQLALSSGYSWNDFDAAGAPAERYTGTRASLQARQALLDLAAYRSLESAQARTEQTRKQRDQVQFDIIQELVTDYLDAVAADDELQALLAEKKAVAGQLARLQQMNVRQLAKVTDVLEAEAYYEDLKARELETQNARAVALERLRATSGVAVREVMPITRERKPPLAEPANRWIQRGLTGNPDLLALQQAILAEEKNIASVRGERWPQLALVGSETYADTAYDNRESPRYTVGSIGVQLTMTLYDGGRNPAALRETQARLQVAKQQFEVKRREIEQEVRAAWLSTETARARIAATAEAVAAQEKARDAQARAYELGAATVVDVLDAERRLFRARTDHAKAHKDFIAGYVNLQRWAGNLSEQEVRTVNGWLGQPVAAATPATP